MSLTLTLLAAQLTFAAAAEENLSIIAKPKAIYEDSSEYNRMNKSYQISAQLFGANPTATTGGGLSVGYFLDRNSMIMADVTSGRTGDNNLFLDNYDVTGTSFGLHYKRFFGNSFYARVGLDQRHIDYKYNYDGIFVSDYDSSMKFTADSLGASIVIGNQWQWENFTMGCDWIGATQPLTHTIKNEELGGNIDQIDRNRLEKDKKTLVTDLTGQGLRFYLGASF